MASRNERHYKRIKKRKNSGSNIDGILTKYKTRLNSYGNGIDNDYLKDGHIWKVITLLEKDYKNYELKKDLVYYVSLLLKYDWERAKDEVSYNGKGLISNCLYIITNLLFAYFAYSFFDGDILLIIVYLFLFAIYYFAPNVIKAFLRLFNVKGAILNTISSYFISILFYILFFAFSDIKQLGILNIPIILQFVSVLINGFSDLEKAKKDYEYIKAIERYNCSVSKKRKHCNNMASKAKSIKKIKKDKQENNKKAYNEHYSSCQIISAPFCILKQCIIYVFSGICYNCKKIVTKEYRLIDKLKSKNEDLKELYK